MIFGLELPRTSHELMNCLERLMNVFASFACRGYHGIDFVESWNGCITIRMSRYAFHDTFVRALHHGRARLMIRAMNAELRTERIGSP